MTKFVHIMTRFVLNMTEFVSYKSGFDEDNNESNESIHLLLSLVIIQIYAVTVNLQSIWRTSQYRLSLI